MSRRVQAAASAPAYVPTARTYAAPQIPTPSAPPTMERAAQVAGEADKKIRGYSAARQGGAAAANARAAQRVTDARARVAAAYNPRPMAEAVQGAVSPGNAPGRGASAAASSGGGGANGGGSAMVTKLEEIKAELQRIRTK